MRARARRGEELQLEFGVAVLVTSRFAPRELALGSHYERMGCLLETPLDKLESSRP